MKKMLFFTALAASLLLACGGPSAKTLIKQGLYKCHDRLETAVREVDRGGYTAALRILEEIKFQCGGSPMMDTVYYYSALAHFRQKQYEDARAEFETLYRENPRSPFAEEAHYRIAQMRYTQSHPSFRDQTETKEAMRLLEDYTDLYPAGAFADSVKALYTSSLNKLAQKEFNNALFYRKQSEHEAALIYYRAVLAEFPESKYAPEAVVGLAEMLVLLGRTQDAQEAIDELEPSAFEEDLRARIEAVREKLKG
ncbi:MAG: outer membrane protein assembly factor BamD [Chitinispirillia bacterium]|nr:outer membrane protein assembly factor BamD [Chitinispirillia bacterium]MCL2242495.1 outer membrane protein assembly factor BamD [Chitinispirillia bacterium]